MRGEPWLSGSGSSMSSPPITSSCSARTLKERILAAHGNAMTALAVSMQSAGAIEAWEKQMDDDLTSLVDEVDRLEAELERQR